MHQQTNFNSNFTLWSFKYSLKSTAKLNPICREYELVNQPYFSFSPLFNHQNCFVIMMMVHCTPVALWDLQGVLLLTSTNVCVSKLLSDKTLFKIALSLHLNKVFVFQQTLLLSRFGSLFVVRSSK